MSDWYHEPANAGDFVDLHARVDSLEAELARLREELTALRAEVLRD